MFPLRTKGLPPDAHGLQNAIEQSLKQVFQPTAPMVEVEDRSYPKLAAIRITLDNAIASSAFPPHLALPMENLEPALRVECLEVKGRPLRLPRAAINFSCVARNAELYQRQDENGDLSLSLQKAAEGRIEVSIALNDLQAWLRAAATAAAAKQGVIVEEAQFFVRARNDRCLEFEARPRVRKLFLNTQLRIRGQVEIDDNLEARVSGIECTGEGTLGTLACGFLDPHLRRFNDRRVSLATLPLTEIRLRNIHIAVDEDLRVNAEFGCETTAKA